MRDAQSRILFLALTVVLSIELQNGYVKNRETESSVL